MFRLVGGSRGRLKHLKKSYFVANIPLSASLFARFVGSPRGRLLGFSHSRFVSACCGQGRGLQLAALSGAWATYLNVVHRRGYAGAVGASGRFQYHCFAARQRLSRSVLVVLWASAPWLRGETVRVSSRHFALLASWGAGGGSECGKAERNSGLSQGWVLTTERR